MKWLGQVARSLAQSVSVGRLNFSVGRPTCILRVYLRTVYISVAPTKLVPCVEVVGQLA